jgi:hypothetical protein
LDVVVVTLNASAASRGWNGAKDRLAAYANQEQAWIAAECLKLARGCLGASKSTTSQSDDCARKIRGTIGRIVPQPSLLISGEPLLYRRLHLNGASGVGGLNPRGRAARNQPPARHYLGGGLFGWLCWRAI